MENFIMEDFKSLVREEKIGNTHFLCCDCLEYMKTVDMGYFHLAVVDVPYGINADTMNMGKTAAKRKKMKFTRGDWDSAVPDQDYWDDLFRISRNQVVWGAQYMLDYLGKTDCMLVWDKDQAEELGFDDFELAWTSFTTKSSTIRRKRGHDQDFLKIHPTQKPVYLYRWIFLNFATKGQRVFDSHAGSHNIAIAAAEFGLHLTICEINLEYHLAGIENFKKHTLQGKLLF